MIKFKTLDALILTAVERIASNIPNPSDPLKGLYIDDNEALTIARGVPYDEELDLRLSEASKILGLDELDTALLSLCAAPELDPRYSRLFSYLHDDIARRLASPRLLGQLLLEHGFHMSEVFRRFDQDAPLRHSGAVIFTESDTTIPLTERLIKIPEQLASYLLRSNLGDNTQSAFLRRVPIPELDPGRHSSIEQIRLLLWAQSRLPIVIAGPDAANLVSAAAERPLLLLNIATLLGPPQLFAQARLGQTLEGALLCFEGLEEISPEDKAPITQALQERTEPTIILTESRSSAMALSDQTIMLVEVEMPSLSEREQAWKYLTGANDCHDVAAKFRLSIGQIAQAASVARLSALSNAQLTSQGPVESNGSGSTGSTLDGSIPAGSASKDSTSDRGATTSSEGSTASGISFKDGYIPTPTDLDYGARQASSSRLGELAHRLDPGYNWENLILPDRQQDLLKSVESFLRHRDLVLSEWGYEKTVARTQGLKVLFAGESGTGKTLAAQVLAADLGLELFRVDLATIVSKYIGETEKNLDRIFSAAEGSNAILFFDEADALFGKRSQVSDAHDRYANIEVAYLLQKMEGYIGAVILATNYRSNIDEAFIRRLDFVIDFPFPEAEDRKRIWKILLPDQAPIANDVDIDFLATKFKLSGGAIRNCSLTAAFGAADDGQVIEMAHLVRAVAQEYTKQGRLTLESDFERFHELIRTPNRRKD